MVLRKISLRPPGEGFQIMPSFFQVAGYSCASLQPANDRFFSSEFVLGSGRQTGSNTSRSTEHIIAVGLMIMLLDETRLIEKLRLIGALFAAATTAGEKVAADPSPLQALEGLGEDAKKALPDQWL